MNQLAELRLCLTDNRDLDMLWTAFTPMRFQATNTSQEDLHWPMIGVPRLTCIDGPLLRLPIWIGVNCSSIDNDKRQPRRQSPSL